MGTIDASFGLATGTVESGAGDVLSCGRYWTTPVKAGRVLFFGPHGQATTCRDHRGASAVGAHDG